MSYPLFKTKQIPKFHSLVFLIAFSLMNCSLGAIKVFSTPTAILNNVILTTQAEVDAFVPGTVFEGTISISGSDIQNLNTFANLAELKGNLIIEDATNLNDISGLSSLKKVSETFYLRSLDQINSLSPLANLASVGGSFEIALNPNLQNLTGLEQLRHAGDLILRSNNSLQNINGLISLRNIAQQLVIDNNRLLENIDGLSQLEQIGLDLFISNNASLENLEGLKFLESIANNLSITDNPRLGNCCGIYDLLNNNGIGANILLENNISFCNAVAEILNNCGNNNGNGNLVTVDLELDLSANPIDPPINTNTELTLVATNTSNVDASKIIIDFPIPDGYSFVGSNTSLGFFNAFPSGVWNIPKLQAGQSAILTVNLFALSDDPTTVFAQVIAQAEDDLDSTPNNNNCLNTIPLCTVTEDDEALLVLNEVIIPPLLPDLVIEDLSGPDIAEAGEIHYYNFTLINEGTTTNPMDFFTTAYLSTDNYWSSNDLAIGQLITNGTPQGALTDLILQVDFPLGQAAGNYFLIFKTDSENVIPELIENNNTGVLPLMITAHSAVSCQGDITISTQEEMDAFGPCVVYDGYIYITGSVHDLKPLTGLKEVKGSFQIGDNSSLVEIRGLSDLTRVEGNFVIRNCDALTDLSGIENLEYIENTMYIGHNNGLQEMSGLNSLPQVTNIQFQNNANLKTISGLNKVSSLSYQLLIYGNPLLESITGFNSLNHIENYLIIVDNTSLESISGFYNLSSIAFYLTISGNPKLESLHGLENLSSVGNGVGIRNNAVLSDCCAIRDLISTPDAVGTIYIIDNPAFCSSVEDIINYCPASDPTLRVDANTTPNNALLRPTLHSLSPNPTTDQLNLQIESGLQGDFVLEVYSSWGKLEQKENLSISAGMNAINLSVNELPPGTYFLILADEHQRIRLSSFVKTGF